MSQNTKSVQEDLRAALLELEKGEECSHAHFWRLMSYVTSTMSLMTVQSDDGVSDGDLPYTLSHVDRMVDHLAILRDSLLDMQMRSRAA